MVPVVLAKKKYNYLILNKIRKECRNTLDVASAGIASILLTWIRTNRVEFTLQAESYTSGNLIRHSETSGMAEATRQYHLIVFYECSLFLKY